MVTASSTSLTCELTPGPAGTHTVTVTVKSSGVARQPAGGALTHTTALTVLANSPAEGSLGGGTLVTVTGTGFPGTMEGWGAGQVTVAGSLCTVTATSFSQFNCTTSSSVSRTEGSGAGRSGAGVEIAINGSSASGGSYSYSAALTPALTSLSPQSGSPLGGGVLTITGTALGAEWGRVTVAGARCKLLSWSDTQATCTLPPTPPGQHAVLVAVPGQGWADTTAVSPYSVVFKVTSLTPGMGSAMGGTKLRLEGAGFGNCSQVTVGLGAGLSCPVSSCTDTELLCTTARLGTTHTVDNGGKHPKYGLGYSWNPQEVTVRPGDTVRWVWTLTTKSSSTGINLHQVDDPTTHEYNGRGFSSGDKKSSGGYSHTFLAPGVYYYSSDSVYGASLHMPGVVRVVADTADTTFDLQVNMTDIPAEQDLSSGGSGTAFTPESGCSVGDTPSCASPPAGGGVWQFLAADCLTPRVTGVSGPGWGHEGDTLTLTGQGFSAQTCQNKVQLGGGECEVTTATPTELQCQVRGGPVSLPSLTRHALAVTVLNRGAALITPPDPDLASFRLYPRIDTTR